MFTGFRPDPHIPAIIQSLRDPDYRPCFLASLSELKKIQQHERDCLGASDFETSRVLHHDRITSCCLVLFNGLGELTGNLDPLSNAAFRMGHNVVAPALPHHYSGCKKGDITVMDFIRRATEIVDLARGLGEELILCGASAGSLMALAAATKTIGTPTRLILTAPAMRFRDTPEWQVDVMIKIADTFPDSDEILPGKRAAGGSRKALASMCKLREEVRYLLSNSDLSHIKSLDILHDPNDQALDPSSPQIAIEWTGLDFARCHEIDFPLHNKVPNPKTYDWSKEYDLTFRQLIKFFETIKC